MKSYHEPIEVATGDDGLPHTWRWRKSIWRVLRVLDRWVLQSRWWAGEAGEEKRTYLLVEAIAKTDPEQTCGCAVEIYLKEESDVWILARILH
jgi:hypothetical protein